MSLNGFAPAAYSTVAVPSVGVVTAIPGSGNATLLVTNLGPGAVTVVLQTSSSAIPIPGAGVVLPGGGSVALTIGSNTYVGAIRNDGAPQDSALNLVAGT
jgi:hypothetical protein